MDEKLAIVMPVYNEEECVGQVFEEWLPVLDSLNINYCFYAYDDGSKDKTLEILKLYESQNSGKVKAISHANKGHGQTCVEGYKLALKEGCHYVLQIDSDGQCDASFFESFWKERLNAPVFGFRATREDGNTRWWISRIVSLVGLLGTGTWVKDANVPYRLIRSKQLISIIDQIPPDFHLANILISLKLRQKYQIQWININFRDRFGGSPSVKTFNFAEQGLKLLKQLWLS